MNKLYRHWLWPLGAQITMFVAFSFLIVGGLAANTSDPAFAKILRNTNLANLMVWSYWWPLIIVFAVLLGRVWCMVCPMELATSLAARVGLKRRPPKFFRNGWAITALYIIILFVGINVLAIHRVPFHMALYLMFLFGLAILSGLIFSKNTFCAHVCPVGHLLGVYARLAPFGFGVKNQDVCTTCEDRSCIAANTRYRFQARSCGVGLNPSKISDNSDCLLCGQCLKACDKFKGKEERRPNPALVTRSWSNNLFVTRSLSSAQAVFVLVVSGFVIYEILTEWPTSKQLLLWAPNWVIDFFGFKNPWAKGLAKSTVLFGILPALIWAIPYGLHRLARGTMAYGDYVRTLAIAFVPVMAAAHIAKSLLKTTSRIPYWEHLWRDPTGMTTTREILDGTITLEAVPAAIAPVLSILNPVLILAGILLSIRVVWNLGRETSLKGWSPFYLIPTIYGGIFLVTIVTWKWL